MRYIDHGSGGPADVLKIAEGSRPEPRDGEILIRVAYAGVNRPDLMQRAGAYPPPAGASPILGLEVAGHCAALGPDCRRWRVGDAVCALVPGGGYAEYCAVPEVHCLPIPAGWSLEQAATLPEVAFTVWANVFELGRLAAGERLLVHGGSSGIGTFAIQLARARGARVATTVGSAEKQAFCRKLGADPAVNHREQDFVAVIRDALGAVDVVLDMVGGDYAARNIALLAHGGRLVQIATLRGATCEIDLSQVMRKRLVITGSTMRARSIDDKAALAHALEQQVWPLIAAGKIKPIIQNVYPLADAAAAHAEMERSQHIGKLVLKVEQGD